MVRYASTRKVQMEVNSMKFTSLGEKIETTYAVRPRTRIASKAWAARSGSV